MSEPIISLQNAVGRNPLTRLSAPADFVMNRQEHIALVGPNGGGKSLLVDLITGAMPLREGTLCYDFGPGIEPRAYGNILQMKFEDAVGTVENPYYYQQRFNSQDRDESPLLRDLLPADAVNSELVDEFMVRDLLDKRLVLLSSGEMRRYQLFRHLIKNPRVLIVDNPFIGLDAPMRAQLNAFFNHLAESGKVQLILMMSVYDALPECITHVVEVRDLKVQPKLSRDAFLSSHQTSEKVCLDDALKQGILELPSQEVASLSKDGVVRDEVIEISNLSLKLEGGRVLYGGMDWVVRRGERWALQGRNGAGKSTLLSLICADHPAAYGCDISLFGRRRGSGESIWEIKKNIGFVSPELHRAYQKNFPAIEIVASGLHDSIGLYKRPKPEQMDICLFWMRVFGIEALHDRNFLTLSSGEQRLVLLARAFVKDPALLILDEPLHGLDARNRELVRQVIDVFCHRPDKTLIVVTHYVEELPEGITYRKEL